MRRSLNQLLSFSAALLLATVTAACSRSDKAELPERSTTMTIKITSTSFAEGQAIPAKYNSVWENRSPLPRLDTDPEAAKSLALICDDPDAPAGTWVHWVLYDLPATMRDLPEAVATKEEGLSGAKQGRNDFKQIGYG